MENHQKKKKNNWKQNKYKVEFLLVKQECV